MNFRFFSCVMINLAFDFFRTSKYLSELKKDISLTLALCKSLILLILQSLMGLIAFIFLHISKIFNLFFFFEKKATVFHLSIFSYLFLHLLNLKYFSLYLKS